MEASLEVLEVSKQQEERLKAARRKTLVTVATISIGLHVAVALIAGIIVVAKALIPTPSRFESKKSVKIESKEREQKMAQSEFEAAASSPSFDNRMTSTRMMDKGLPPLPKMPIDQVLPINPSAALSDNIMGLAGGGIGSGLGGGMDQGVGFFGIKDTGTKIIIAVDSSNTMFGRNVKGKMIKMPYHLIKEEAIKLINGLGINTMFGLIIWEGGSLSFRPGLVPATDQNKAAARDWIRNIDEDPAASMSKQKKKIGGTLLQDGTGGTRTDLALQQAFSLQPQIIYLISDGEANRGGAGGKIAAEELWDITAKYQKNLPQEARLHSIYFLTEAEKKSEREMLEGLARRNKGKFIIVDAKKLEAEQGKTQP